jgi:uncharacterized membrane protein/glutaredoxin
MIFSTTYPNPEAVTIGMVRASGASVSIQQILDELNKHPDYPNLTAIADVLHNFGIASDAYHVPREGLSSVPLPFIAHTIEQGKEFLYVSFIDDRMLTVTANGHEKFQLPREEFYKVYDGIVLVPEDQDRPMMNKGNKNVRLPDLYQPALLLLLLLVLALAASRYSPVFQAWYLIASALFKSAGLIVSIMLLVQSVDRTNPLIQKLCSGSGNGNTDCHAILASDAAIVFKGLTWSEVGFFYFSGTWLALVFGPGSEPVIYILAILNLLCLPYTLYSVHYQFFVAKKWCVLCCTVQAILWLDFIVQYNVLMKPFPLPAINDLSVLAIGAGLPVILWLFLRPVLKKAQQVIPLRNQLRSIKYNSETFRSLLESGPKYVPPQEDWSIVLGNVEASNVITMVSNPYCPPCAEAHEVLDEWLAHEPDVQVRIVFTADNTDKDIKTPVARHLMALGQLSDRTIVKSALRQWFSQKHKDLGAWQQKYPATVSENDLIKMEKQKAWIKMAEIRSTPTILVNGHQLPDAYQLGDIKYLLT